MHRVNVWETMEKEETCEKGKLEIFRLYLATLIIVIGYFLARKIFTNVYQHTKFAITSWENYLLIEESSTLCF